MKTKLSFCSIFLVLLVLANCKTEPPPSPPVPIDTTPKVGDKYAGGYVFKKSNGSFWVVKNTQTSNAWDTAKSKEVNGWRLPTCEEMKNIFKIEQDSSKIDLGIISGIYWVGVNQIDKDYGPTYERGRTNPCYQIMKKNKINIILVKRY